MRRPRVQVPSPAPFSGLVIRRDRPIRPAVHYESGSPRSHGSLRRIRIPPIRLPSLIRPLRLQSGQPTGVLRHAADYGDAWSFAGPWRCSCWERRRSTSPRWASTLGVSWTHSLFFALTGLGAGPASRVWLVLRPLTDRDHRPRQLCDCRGVGRARNVRSSRSEPTAHRKPSRLPRHAVHRVVGDHLSCGLLLISDRLVRHRVSAAMGWIRGGRHRRCRDRAHHHRIQPLAIASGADGHVHSHDASATSAAVARARPPTPHTWHHDRIDDWGRWRWPGPRAQP